MGSEFQVTDRLIIVIMRFLIFITCVAVAIAAPKLAKLRGDIPWEWCGDGRPIDIPELTLEPFPVVVAPGASITFAATIEVLEVIPVGAKIQVDIVKEGIINIPVPCLEVNGQHFGSCEYDGDYLLSTYADGLCGDALTPGGYFPPGQACNLPLNPGTYGGKDPITTPLPADLPAEIVNLVKGAKLHADLKVLAADGSEMGCARVHIEIAN